MNFLSLEYFLVIAEEKSIKTAAERLYVSQQSLSEHVKRLEAELGLPLINRARPLTLTQAGKRLFDGAREILQARSRLLADVGEIRRAERAGSITVGIDAMGAPPFLPELITRFARVCPDCTVNVVNYDSRQPLADSARGIDLFFPVFPLDDDMEHDILRKDYLAVIVGRRLMEKVYGAEAEAVCRRLRQTGDLSLLREVPFLSQFGPAQTREGGRIDLSQYGISAVSGLKTDSGSFRFLMCLEGAGALVSLENAVVRLLESYSADVRRELLVFRLNHESERYSLSISYKKGKRLSAAEQAFIGQARLMFQNG